MSQQAFFSVALRAAASSPISVQLGFQAGRIELINLTAVQTPTNTEGFRALWQIGMANGSAITSTYNATFQETPAYTATNGITLLNPLGSEHAQYGAIVSGFTNANPGVITVDSTFTSQITAGSFIKVEGIADNQTGTQGLNGVYYVASVTATTITVGTAPAGVTLPAYPPYVVKGLNTTGYAVYISGGFVTVIQNANPIIPNPPFNVNSNVPSFWNQAIQGFIIGTSAFAGATYSLTTPDIILVSAWDMMSP